MSQEQRQPGWTVLSASRIGSVHVRDELPLQDAVLTWSDGAQAVAAVADGHGHKAHFRSDIGSALAAVSAVEELRRVLGDLTDPEAAGDVVTAAAAAIVDSWVTKVRHHIEANPFDVAADERHAAAVHDPLRPYGTTLLAAAVSGDLLVVLQIGDGDAVLVTDQGEALRAVADDPQLDGMHTSSLCEPQPLRALRTCGHRHPGRGRRTGVPLHRRLRHLARRRRGLVAPDRRAARRLRPHPRARLDPRTAALVAGGAGPDRRRRHLDGDHRPQQPRRGRQRAPGRPDQSLLPRWPTPSTSLTSEERGRSEGPRSSSRGVARGTSRPTGVSRPGEVPATVGRGGHVTTSRSSSLVPRDRSRSGSGYSTTYGKIRSYSFSGSASPLSYICR